MKYLSEIPQKKTFEFESTLQVSYTSVMRVSYASEELAVINGNVDSTGTWSYYGLREIIKNHMLENNLWISGYVIQFDLINGALVVDTDTENAEVLFFESRVLSPGADECLDQNFVHNYPAFITDGEVKKLYFLPDAPPSTRNIPYTKKVVAKVDGQITEFNTTHTFLNRSDFMTVTMADTADYLAEDIISISISIEHKQITIYAIHGYVHLFRFRNQWNVEETIPIQGGLTIKPSTEFETASIGDINVHYDVEHTEETSLVTPPIVPQYRDVLTQLVRSNRVEYFNPQTDGHGDEQIGWQDIIVTDYTLEHSDTPNSPLTFEMTFERADKINTVFLD